ncbi:rhodanese-like domain-containing protein [Pelagicoccus sp. SDUM812002]|uniref:rhodanese-like domain-containing protein n=1 Tax=Pelagicoccus sp. SDUM812002 TaxID=3041266 RepID=UPI00280E6546|nr:rhodanese-like domain-containing protein [Pelagicoccus sp. SDUM812002]MDQ8187520.1 rhodanese-like domain-containing protein [Pelagicoccus sp. SDUM812002]
MKVFLSAISLFLSFAPPLFSETEQAEANRFAALIEKENTLLVDVRTPDETRQEKIEGAIEFDFYADDFAQKVLQLPKDKTLLLYCRSGNRSGQAAQLLESKGYDQLVNLEGGIKAWKEANLPIVNDED